VWLTEPPKHWNFHRLSTLEHKNLALVGLGGIGTEIATRALPFGMNVRAVRRTDVPSPVAGVEVVTDFATLLPDADHLVLAAPGTARTRHLVDEAALNAVKPGVHLVNIARGSLVDQDALRAALDDGRVAMATLDTVDPEPLPAGHWMYEHPKVRLSAHVSRGTTEHFTGAIEVLVENLHRHLDGRPLRDLVDLAEGY
jgi:phosphoglycerate dehydrogenase-like enzyme